MPVPIVVPIILGALGGGGLAAWVAQDDDDWADSTVFNARMRDIHMGILQLNDQLAKCKAIHNGENAATLKAWRDFVKSWSAFYGDVGTVWFSPGKQVIQEAKRKAAMLAKWIDDYRLVCGELPTGSVTLQLPTESLPPDPYRPVYTQEENDNWRDLAAKLGVVLAFTTAGLILFNNYTKPSDRASS